MHYYQFNIGDYASHTRHLSLIEDAIYRRLLDVYYLHERPLNSGIASVARQIDARDHEAEVKIILEEYFQLTDRGWINVRADKEIQHFHSKIEQASKAGKASAEARLSRRSTGVPTDVQPTNNHKPITNNHIKDIRPEDVELSVWQDFLKHRKTKKAEVTETVLKTIRTEADKAGWKMQDALTEMCSRGWTGFKADWVKGKVEAVPEWKLRIK